MPSALRASAAASGVSRPSPARSRRRCRESSRASSATAAEQRHERRPEPGLPDVGDQRRDDDQKRRRFAGRHHQAEEADRDRRQALAEHAFDETGEHESKARERENEHRIRHVQTVPSAPDNGNAHAAHHAFVPCESMDADLQRLAAHQPRLRARGRTPSRMTARRSGPIRSTRIKAEPARALQRQEVGQQRAVEQIDREACGSSRRRGGAYRSARAARARRRRRRRGAPPPRARRWSRHRAGRG